MQYGEFEMQYVVYGNSWPVSIGPRRASIREAIKAFKLTHEGVDPKSVHAVDPDGEIHNKALYIFEN